MHGWCLECCSHSCHSQGWIHSWDEGSTAPWKQMQQHGATGVEDHICDFQCLLEIPDLLWRSQPGCPTLLPPACVKVKYQLNYF